MYDVELRRLSPKLQEPVRILLDKIDIASYGDFYLDSALLNRMKCNAWDQNAISLLLLKAMQHLRMPFETIAVSIAQEEKRSTFYVTPGGVTERGHENTSGNYRTDGAGLRKQITVYYNARYQPRNVIAILLHEITHHFLFWKSICVSDTEENERMTDAAAALLGFGDYMADGYKEITWETPYGLNKTQIHTVKIGYLSNKSMEEISVFRRRALSFQAVDVNYHGQGKRSGHFNSIFSGLKRKFQKQKATPENVPLEQLIANAKREAENFDMLVSLNESIVSQFSARNEATIPEEDIAAISQAIYLVQSGENQDRKAAFHRKCSMMGENYGSSYFADLRKNIEAACCEIAVFNALLSKYL